MKFKLSSNLLFLISSSSSLIVVAIMSLLNIFMLLRVTQNI